MVHRWFITSDNGTLNELYFDGRCPHDNPHNIGAAQPDDSDRKIQRKFTAERKKARDDLRHAQHLDKQRQKGHRVSWHHRALLHDFDSGQLYKKANDATKASGHGRIRNSDGSYTDIGGSCGGVTRTVLDKWIALVISMEDRIRNNDGIDDDIGGLCGGATRTIVDNWIAPVIPAIEAVESEYEPMMVQAEEDMVQAEEEDMEPDWGA